MSLTWARGTRRRSTPEPHGAVLAEPTRELLDEAGGEDRAQVHTPRVLRKQLVVGDRWVIVRTAFHARHGPTLPCWSGRP